MLGNFYSFFFCLLTFFKINFVKNLSGTLSECQMVWIQIRTYILSVLIWVTPYILSVLIWVTLQSVCKDVTASKERV